jgi:hypothetical protein
MALFPSANYSADRSGWVGKPAADSNDHLERFFKKFEAYQTANIVRSELPHLTQLVQIQKREQNGHHYLQRAVTPDQMGNIVL